jgi:hypothetical protein
VAALFMIALASACGARTPLDESGAGAGGSPLVCPSWKTCDPPPDECTACALPRIASCAGITDCDPGAGGCAGDLPSNHACRVWAAAAIPCLLSCPDDHLQCDEAYFDSGKGPIFPVGLAFNDFACAVCNDCADACASTPNFHTLCSKL